MSTGERSADISGEAPWIGYDNQDVATIRRFVAKSCPTQARAVRVYESARMDRPEVVDATDRRLAKWHA